MEIRLALAKSEVVFSSQGPKSICTPGLFASSIEYPVQFAGQRIATIQGSINFLPIPKIIIVLLFVVGIFVLIVRTFAIHLSSQLSQFLIKPVLSLCESRELPENEIYLQEVKTIEKNIKRLKKDIQGKERQNFELLMSKELGEQAAQVAHDIRSPLAALDSVVVGLPQLPGDKRLIIRSALGRIRDISNSLLEKNSEVLKKSKTDKGGGHSEAKNSMSIQLLSGLVDSLVTEKRLQFRSKLGVTIEVDLTTEAYGLFSKIDPVEFNRVLSNIINNAVESLPDQGIVYVSLKGLHDTIEVKIEDNGKGIYPHILPTLMQAGVTHGKEGGSGLGLYHAQGSLKAVGGALRLSSTVGKGTTAFITLPRAMAPLWFVDRLEVAEQTQVIILDDDKSVHQIWRGRFKSLNTHLKGIVFHHFSIPEDLIQWKQSEFLKTRPALYLVDYEIIGHSMNGLDVIESLEIQKESILVTSRYEEPAIRERCISKKLRLIPKGMVGFVPIEISRKKEFFDAILIDDDVLIRLIWTQKAKSLGKRFRAFATATEFTQSLDSFERSIPIYVDSNLGDEIKGEDVLKDLRYHGFSTLLLATGFDSAFFPEMPWVTAIVGKEPPWM